MPKEFAQQVSQLLFPLISKEQNPYPCFSTGKIPSISLKQYFIRLSTHFNCSDSCYILAIVYIMRLSKFVQLNEFNIHRVLLISLVLSAKIGDDEYYENKYYAKIGGVSNKEVNEMELEFTKQIGFDLYVGEGEYQFWLKKLMEMND